jgi:hypothetical protein
MAKTSLTDMQRVLLSNASMRLDFKLLPPPKCLKVDATDLARSVKVLVTRGLVAEVVAERADAIWRETQQGGRTTLVITAAGMEAIGVSADDQVPAITGIRTEVFTDEVRRAEGHARSCTTPPSTPRSSSKLGIVIALLRLPVGATITELMDATAWQPHSVRGAISGMLKKRFGLVVVSAMVEGRGRVYRIVDRAEVESGAACIDAAESERITSTSADEPAAGSQLDGSSS